MVSRDRHFIMADGFVVNTEAITRVELGEVLVISLVDGSDIRLIGDGAREFLDKLAPLMGDGPTSYTTAQ